MPELNYRDAKREDLPGIVDIYNSTVASRMVTADLRPVSVADREKWFADHDPRKRPLWVVENASGEMVGWCSLQSFYGRQAYDATVEVSIYLAPEQRGKGFGKQVLQYCINQAPRFGIKTLLGFIFQHNIPSLQLFYHFGFKDWGLLPDIARLDDCERSLVIVGKRIG
ncbi:GNAT family N-acetyltransferase [Parabacteroides sp. Marseille-P3160]|uniref:GNAT family N-acetyltransferase n=1 Tax=Parabacteroides sp. Marseille-P3160 TaxID=1917887 RepID=UPI000B40DCA2|nr:GNAT family N-acetyltransferase [Parabacteroides sp. Marseille-P3160]